MRRSFFCLLIVVFSVPLLAQETPKELNQEQFQEIMKQFLGQQNLVFDQLLDSMKMQMPNDGSLKFFQFSEVDSTMQHFPMEDMQKTIENGLGMMGQNNLFTPFGEMEQLDMSDLLNMNQDSLKEQLRHLEQFFGEDFERLAPKKSKEESTGGKKKRKTYSL